MASVTAGIFIGVTLGISSDADTVRALMIALFFHQGNEGLALGCLFVKAGYSRLKYCILAAAFVIVTPLVSFSSSLCLLTTVCFVFIHP